MKILLVCGWRRSGLSLPPQDSLLPAASLQTRGLEKEGG